MLLALIKHVNGHENCSIITQATGEGSHCLFFLPFQEQRKGPDSDDMEMHSHEYIQVARKQAAATWSTLCNSSSVSSSIQDIGELVDKGDLIRPYRPRRSRCFYVVR